MTWKKASGTGAIIAAWGGLFLAITGWLIAAQAQSGEISVESLGTNEAMLSGNLIAIFSSGIIHFLYSLFVDPQDYNFDELDTHITLVENDTSGLTAEEKDPVVLANAEKWITRRGYVISLILIVIWPLMSVPAGKFTEAYFSFWVLVAIAWGFGAAIIITVLPLTESSEVINKVLGGIWTWMTCRGLPTEEVEKIIEDEKDVAVEHELVPQDTMEETKNMPANSDTSEEQA